MTPGDTVSLEEEQPDEWDTFCADLAGRLSKVRSSMRDRGFDPEESFRLTEVTLGFLLRQVWKEGNP